MSDNPSQDVSHRGPQDLSANLVASIGQTQPQHAADKTAEEVISDNAENSKFGRALQFAIQTAKQTRAVQHGATAIGAMVSASEQAQSNFLEMKREKIRNKLQTSSLRSSKTQSMKEFFEDTFEGKVPDLSECVYAGKVRGPVDTPQGKKNILPFVVTARDGSLVRFCYNVDEINELHQVAINEREAQIRGAQSNDDYSTEVRVKNPAFALGHPDEYLSLETLELFHSFSVARDEIAVATKDPKTLSGLNLFRDWLLPKIWATIGDTRVGKAIARLQPNWVKKAGQAAGVFFSAIMEHPFITTIGIVCMMAIHGVTCAMLQGEPLSKELLQHVFDAILLQFKSGWVIGVAIRWIRAAWTCGFASLTSVFSGSWCVTTEIANAIATEAKNNPITSAVMLGGGVVIAAGAAAALLPAAAAGGAAITGAAATSVAAGATTAAAGTTAAGAAAAATGVAAGASATSAAGAAAGTGGGSIWTMLTGFGASYGFTGVLYWNAGVASLRYSLDCVFDPLGAAVAQIAYIPFEFLLGSDPSAEMTSAIAASPLGRTIESMNSVLLWTVIYTLAGWWFADSTLVQVTEKIFEVLGAFLPAQAKNMLREVLNSFVQSAPPEIAKADGASMFFWAVMEMLNVRYGLAQVMGVLQELVTFFADFAGCILSRLSPKFEGACCPSELGQAVFGAMRRGSAPSGLAKTASVLKAGLMATKETLGSVAEWIWNVSDYRLKIIVSSRKPVEGIPINCYIWKTTASAMKLRASLDLIEPPSKAPFWGVSARVVQKHYPEAVREFGPFRVLCVNYQFLPPKLRKALQKLNGMTC